MEKSKQQKNKVRFVVVREFSGEKSMREAFEQLIERQTCEHFEEWRQQREMAEKAAVSALQRVFHHRLQVLVHRGVNTQAAVVQQIGRLGAVQAILLRKSVDSGTGTWYYNGIVSLFIEGERYEQEKTSL